jgi:16S rRNA (guanine966-N2)-methyltransferase
VAQLADGAMVLIERSTRSPEPTLPPGLVALRKKAYGETVLWWSEPETQKDAGSVKEPDALGV